MSIPYYPYIAIKKYYSYFLLVAITEQFIAGCEKNNHVWGYASRYLHIFHAQLV